MCPDGKFGLKCEDDCHCLISEDCNKENGDCNSQCAAGWTGGNCQQSKALIYIYIRYTGDKSFFN